MKFNAKCPKCRRINVVEVDTGLARAGGAGRLTDRDLAGILGKTHDAVRSELTRQRKVGGLPPDKAPKAPRRRPARPRRPRAV